MYIFCIFKRAGSQGSDITHPHVSKNSWIRAQPEGGSNYIAMYRSDQASPQLTQSFARGAADRLKNYKDGEGVYRTLYPGAH